MNLLSIDTNKKKKKKKKKKSSEVIIMKDFEAQPTCMNTKIDF